MNLHKVVERFSTETFVNPYDEAQTLKGTIKPFTEATNSGPASRRRILEMMPSETMFSEHIVRHGSTTYVVGGRNVDHWRGTEVRAKYPILPCDLTMRVGSVAQVLTDTLPTRLLYCYPHLVRHQIYDEEASWMQSGFSLYFGKSEDFVMGQVAHEQGSHRYFRFRSQPYLDGALFQTIEAILVDNPIQTVSYSRETGYDPVTDTITEGTVVDVTVFFEDAFVAFDHTSERYSMLKAGDKNITVVLANAPRTGETFDDYSILSVDVVGTGCYSCHCRR